MEALLPAWYVHKKINRNLFALFSRFSLYHCISIFYSCTKINIIFQLTCFNRLFKLSVFIFIIGSSKRHLAKLFKTNFVLSTQK